MNTIKVGTGGRPLHNDDLTNIYLDLFNTTSAIAAAINEDSSGISLTPSILWGMNLTGNIVGDGAIIGPYGEIYTHTETTYPGFDGATFNLDFISTDTDSRSYSDGNSKYCYTTRLATLTKGIPTAGWNALSYNTSIANRLSDKFHHILNNKLKYDAGDIWSTDVNGLQLQSQFGMNTDLYLSRYGGDVTIGGNDGFGLAYNKNIELFGNVQMINKDAPYSAYSGAFYSGHIDLPVTSFDKMVYFYSNISVTNDFDVMVYVNGTAVVRTGPYLGGCVMVPAGVICILILQSGTAEGFQVHIQRMGRTT